MGRSGALGRLIVLSSLVIALVIQPATTWSQTPPPFAPFPPETPAAAPHPRAVDAVRDAAVGTLTVAGGVARPLTWRPCATTALPPRGFAEFGAPLNYREPQGAPISPAGRP